PSCSVHSSAAASIGPAWGLGFPSANGESRPTAGSSTCATRLGRGASSSLICLWRQHWQKPRQRPNRLTGLLFHTMGLGRVELPTSRLSGVRSNHLSYRPRLGLGVWIWELG